MTDIDDAREQIARATRAALAALEHLTNATNQLAAMRPPAPHPGEQYRRPQPYRSINAATGRHHADDPSTLDILRRLR